MTTELDKLLAVLPPVFAGSAEKRELKILKNGEVACAFRIPLRDLRSAWSAAAALHPKTGMWPVAVTCRDPAGIAAEDIFSRNYFREETARADHDPRAIVERAQAVDVDKFLAKLALQAAEGYDIHGVEEELDAMRFAVNKAPKRPEVDAAIRSRKIRDRYAFDRWLLDWELTNKVKRDPREGRHEPVAREPVYLLFVPVANSWDALAYIHWYGCLQYNTEALIALGHAWQKRYGAEVFAVYGTTTLECLVARPPKSLEAAWSLARDHDLVSPSANAASGTPVRQYALSLVNHGHWSFHERP